MSKHNLKKVKRLKRAKRSRVKQHELNAVRLVVHKTNKHIYAQVITPDVSDKVIAAASTNEKNAEKSFDYKNSPNLNVAKKIGELVAERALEKGIKKVSFDRSGFKYHGRIKALAEGAREAGLDF